MEFSDLNDEIGADDWLISSEEITKRRLVRRTPRYNIYKADWFGDVLVYEPTTTMMRRAANNKCKSRQELYASSIEQGKHKLCRLKLISKLEELSSMNSSSSSFEDLNWTTITTPEDVLEQQTDSAYSSISSTPQYHTKSLEQNEFEFPSVTCSYRTIAAAVETSTNRKEEDLREQKLKKPMILNKDFYMLNSGEQEEVLMLGLKEKSLEKSLDMDLSTNQSSWFELNELRLVAHESFMLFMGASPLASTSLDPNEAATALVMQMNHPKAMSLYNLLHDQKLINASPIERFFASKRQQLGLEAKLNICQQVTNAMTYLHDKNIVHGKLTSVNIYLELNQRVKISLLDNDETALVVPVAGGCRFNLPALTHLSPELVRSIELVPTTTNAKCDNDDGGDDDDDQRTLVQINSTQLTKMTDVFSFGTLLFELFEEQFPFAQDLTFDFRSLLIHFDSPQLFTPRLESPLDGRGTAFNWNGNITVSAQELIFQIGSGLIGEKNLDKLTNRNRCPARVQEIIAKCWSEDPVMRPNFKALSFSF